jgi:hypothetical protein
VLPVTWVCSSACPCAIDCRWCAQLHLTAQESHGVGTNAMELGQQADVECARSHILRSNTGFARSMQARSISVTALESIGRDQMCILSNSTL